MQLVGVCVTAFWCAMLNAYCTVWHIFTNRSLVYFQQIVALGGVLSFHRTILQTLDITGNLLGGKGLESLSGGLKLNKSLETILLADNNISSSDANEEGLQAFMLAIKKHPALTCVDFRYNPIGDNAKLLVEALEKNTQISTFKVDASVPDNLFGLLHRNSAPKKKAGKSKKKKK